MHRKHQLIRTIAKLLEPAPGLQLDRIEDQLKAKIGTGKGWTESEYYTWCTPELQIMHHSYGGSSTTFTREQVLFCAKVFLAEKRRITR